MGARMMRKLLTRLRGVSVTLMAQTDRWTYGQLAGLAAFLVGVGMVSVPAAFILGGLLTTAVSYGLAEADQREQRTREG